MSISSSKAELIKKYAIQAIDSELQSLQHLGGFVGDDFASVIELLLKNEGRAIFTGIGKSAIIAQKIVATMNSTGQPALFMHAADAIHGDLGMIQKNDIVIAISKSGNTPEIQSLVPLLKRYQNILVAMVGNMHSKLAETADYVLNTSVDTEACPNNLAPTTSTTAQLLMGDAMAIALIQMRGFGSDDFSKYHPGGTLGKRLYLECGSIAEQNQKPQVKPNSPWKEVILSITKNRLGATAVVDAHNKVLGIVTDGDVRRMLEKNTDFDSFMAADMMGNNPVMADVGTLASEIVAMMQDKKITQIIVTQESIYFGMVHLHDFYKEGIV
ncbi:MAG: KpsF/GutQ family sugar-phosphate isomerase [Bacteroidetes bacterium]|nr:KpsF/GutQ family sugar-phosphate isomerase [Bacteroidota bacterium]MSP57622.1 KpsF/GutQ family sugar-phosphate isomerase [Flavobacteriaceae bacterium]